MPHAAEDSAPIPPEVSREASAPSEPAEPGTPGGSPGGSLAIARSAGNSPGRTSPDAVPKPGSRGTLFRVLLEAGAPPIVAYTAEEQAQSMVSEAAAAQVQPILLEMRRLFADQRRQIADHGQQIAALRDAVAKQGQQIAALTAVVTRHDEKLDGLKRELRLIWGALGALLTLLTVVFGFLFSG